MRKKRRNEVDEEIEGVHRLTIPVAMHVPKPLFVPGTSEGCCPAHLGFLPFPPLLSQETHRSDPVWTGNQTEIHDHCNVTSCITGIQPVNLAYFNIQNIPYLWMFNLQMYMFSPIGLQTTLMNTEAVQEHFQWLYSETDIWNETDGT